MRSVKRTLFICLSFLLITLFCSCKQQATKEIESEQEAFQTFLNALFSDMVASDSITLNYTLSNPSMYHVPDHEVTLGEFSLREMKQSLATEENYLHKLSQFNYSLLTKKQKLTYDILKENLAMNHDYGNYLLYSEVLGPTTGIQAQLPILLAEYKFHTVKDIEDYFLLLRDVTPYFADICEFERQKAKAKLFMSDDVADAIIDQCASFLSSADSNYLVEYFNDKMDRIDSLSKEDKTAYKKENKELISTYVIPAYENLIFTLKQLKGTGVNTHGLCYFKKGKEYYEYLVKSTTGSSKSIPKISSMLEKALNESLLDMSLLMNTDPSALSKLKSYEFIETDPDKTLTYLKHAIKNDFPPLPNVDCTIKYVHSSLQEYVSPAMYLVPPIDNYKENCIYINKNPNYDLSQLFTTLAHEGYPGHLYQCVYFRSKEPHPIRSILDYVGYDEGWATYAEMYSYSIAGLDETVYELLKDNMIATHCIYSRTDIGIHYEGWTFDEVSQFLGQFVSEDSVQLIYQTLLEEPALYLPYSVGYLEFMEMKKNAQFQLSEAFDLKEFHEFILDIGPCSFDLLNKQMDAWINNQTKATSKTQSEPFHFFEENTAMHFSLFS